MMFVCLFLYLSVKLIHGCPISRTPNGIFEDRVAAGSDPIG